MKQIVTGHMLALILGYIMDIIFGDPYSLPHPIRTIGNLISLFEKKFIGDKNNTKILSDNSKRKRGTCLVIIMLAIVGLTTSFLIIFSYKLHMILGIFVEAILTYYILAIKCLKDESMKVYYAIEDDDIDKARYAVSMIVGRDTDKLDYEGITKAAVETVAENTSDGIIAPMLYTAIGGPILGLLYKTVNTMDSMVGYKNERYLYFGRAAARLDDVLNYLPARISAYLMIISCAILGDDFNTNNAYKIYKRDKRKHSSPNSAHTEAVCAGALSIRLAGNASYFGKIYEKPYIGDDIRPIENSDIKKANKLLYMTSFVSIIVCELLLSILLCIM